MTTTTTMFIPRDIIVEILSWLPAKSVLRLRWACKYWFDLITRDSNLIKLQLQRRLTSTIQHPVSVLIHSSDKCVGRGANKYSELNQCYLNTSVVSPQVRISYPFQSPTGFVSLGSCNGLLLCRNSDDRTKLCIWNPCTQEYKVLPNPPSPEKCKYPADYGFGYDPMLDDYNVTIISYNVPPRSTYLSYYVQVYTLGTNSWKSIEVNPCIYKLSKGKYVNGCLYWMDRYYGKSIISFDIGKKKSQEVSIEQFLCHGNRVFIELQVFEGSLCLVQVIQWNTEFSLQMWVMEEDKRTANESSRTSWAQLFTTPISSRIHYPIETPIRCGEIMLLKKDVKDQLFLYDPKSNTTMDFRVIRRRKKYLSMKEFYMDSLISLNKLLEPVQSTGIF